MRPWVAPTPAGPVTGALTVPGSKSATARGYVLAALGDGPSVLTGVLDARDTRLMRQGLAGLGVTFASVPGVPDAVRITPPEEFRASHVECGQAGTIMRFVPPLSALAHGATAFTGDPEASVRPVGPLLDGLAQAGVRIENPGRPGVAPTAVPFSVVGSGAVPGGEVRIDASASSQFVSGLLLSAARFTEGLSLTHAGARVPSAPHIALTLAMLADRGVVASASDHTWRVEPGPIAARDETIEPDLINAAVFLAAALVTGGSVTVGWPRHTAQAGEVILGTLTALGGHVQGGDDTVTVRGTGVITGADLDLSHASELTCVAASLLALADRPGRIRGVGHIRHHETDRLAALEAELGARGAGVAQTSDGLTVRPAPLSGGPWHTYADHRMAHAGAVLGLAVPGITLDDVDATTKTLADFAGLWHHLVAA